MSTISAQLHQLTLSLCAVEALFSRHDFSLHQSTKLLLCGICHTAVLPCEIAHHVSHGTNRHPRKPSLDAIDKIQTLLRDRYQVPLDAFPLEAASYTTPRQPGTPRPDPVEPIPGIDIVVYGRVCSECGFGTQDRRRCGEHRKTHLEEDRSAVTFLDAPVQTLSLLKTRRQFFEVKSLQVVTEQFPEKWTDLRRSAALFDASTRLVRTQQGNICCLSWISKKVR